jgi:hypothetical protein
MNLRNNAFSPPRSYRLVVVFVSAVAVLGGLVVACWLAHWPSGVFGGSARSFSVGGATASSAASARSGPTNANSPPNADGPADALAAVTGLASRNPAVLSAALAAGYPVTGSDVAPAGTTIRVQPGTWQQRGDYATVRAVVTLPGRAPLSETVYLVRGEGRWRVLFADPA